MSRTAPRSSRRARLSPPAGRARNATSKTFATAEPGRYVSRLYASRVHFRAAACAWRDIDTTPAPSPPDGRLRTRAHSVAVERAPLADDVQSARVDLDPEHSVAYRPEGAAAPVGHSGTLASCAAVLPDVAVELRAFPGRAEGEPVPASWYGCPPPVGGCPTGTVPVQGGWRSAGHRREDADAPDVTATVGMA